MVDKVEKVRTAEAAGTVERMEVGIVVQVVFEMSVSLKQDCLQEH